MSSSPFAHWATRVTQDASFALRQLARAPSFTIASVATLAIGIGATAAVFSLVEAVVLRPLPFAEPDRVVNLHPARNGEAVLVASNFELATWSELPRVFEHVAAIVSPNPFTLTLRDAPEALTGARVSSGYFAVLGVMPELGRRFTPADDQPGAPHVVLLSHHLWRRALNGEPSIIGATVRLDGEPYTVIGVMPAALDEAGSTDELWVPLALSPAQSADFKNRYLQVVARLSRGTPIGRATAAVDDAERSMAAQFPMWGRGYGGQVHRYADDLFGNFRSRLFILLGAVSCVLLIACANVSNLLLARGGAREREMAIRTALGAGKRRLFGQMLTESAVLCLAAGAVALALASVLVRGLIAMSPPGVPRIEQARIDGGVLLFAFGACALCTVIAGLVPALRVAGPSMQPAIREGRASGERPSRARARDLLVGAEVALAMTLLTGAALLIHTAWDIDHVDPGFDSRDVLTAQLLLPAARYPDLPSSAQAFRAVLDAVGATPGVRSASFTSSVPLAGAASAGIGAEGQPMTDGERLIVSVHVIAPDYFSTMGIPLHAGRDFRSSDNASAPNVTIITEALARRLWPGQRALGRRMEGMDPSHQHFMEVIGIAADQRDVSLDQAPAPMFYIPYEQTPPPLWSGLQGSLTLVVRTASSPRALEGAIRRAVDGVDPDLPLANVSTMDDAVRASLSTAHFNTLLLSVLGAIALVLASVGVYGVIAYSVSQRTREIGVRIALGSSPMIIAALILKRGLVPIVSGIVAGAVLSMFATRLLREQLYGVAPGDPFTLVAIAAVLLLVSLVAIYVPSRRAMRISPVMALTS